MSTALQHPRVSTLASARTHVNSPFPALLSWCASIRPITMKRFSEEGHVSAHTRKSSLFRTTIEEQLRLCHCVKKLTTAPTRQRSLVSSLVVALPRQSRHVGAVASVPSQLQPAPSPQPLRISVFVMAPLLWRLRVSDLASVPSQKCACVRTLVLKPLHRYPRFSPCLSDI